MDVDGSCEWLGPIGLIQPGFFRSLLVVFTGILGAGALFELKKIAFTLFQISLAVNVLYTLWTLLKTSSGDALPPGGLIGMISGLVVVGLIVLYVYRLKQRGVLE
jgi:hypothetical protein